MRTELVRKLIETYEGKKRDLVMEDIKSYSAYAQKLLERAIEQDTIEGRFQFVSVEDNTVLVKDYLKAKTAEVVINEKSKVYCRLDATGECEHVGYVLSEPSVIKRAKELGVKLRKAELA